MRILFASSEVSPFAKTGGLGDVAGALPKALAAAGHDVIVVTPHHRAARAYLESSTLASEWLPPLDVDSPAFSYPAGVRRSTLPGTDVPIYFIASNEFFDRPFVYSNREDGFDDQLERFSFFSHAAVALARRLGGAYDVLHAHDWHTALIPVLQREKLHAEETFSNARTVFTIHNLAYQGVYPAQRFRYLGIRDAWWSSGGVEHFGEINLMKAGIAHCDSITTVSPTYAKEIQTAEHGSGLDGLLRELSWKLTGILNGIDEQEWDPANDPRLAANFDPVALAGKSRCKKALRKETGLIQKAKAPLFGLVSRLVGQKGIDLLLPALPSIVGMGAQIVILGSGEPQYESALRLLDARLDGNLRFIAGFDNDLAHRIYAAADVILMPSLYEPCGLNQMYALRYGAPPLVRLTGGLIDTVLPFDGSNGAVATGFAFERPDSIDLRHAAFVATLAYRDEKLWRQLQRNGMEHDHSWAASAKEYIRVYQGDS